MARFLIPTLYFALAAALFGQQSAVSLRLTFGERQERPKDYSGSIAVSQGKVAEVRPWRFDQSDSIEGAAWKLKLELRPFENQPNEPRTMSADPATINVPPAGVTAVVSAGEAATVRVKTAQGEFSFSLAEAPAGKTLRFLDGDVLVERTPSAERANEFSEAEHFDYPAVAESADGTVWMTWQGYAAQGDHVYARRKTAAGWSQTWTLTAEKTDVLRTAVALDSAGRTWAVWSERQGAQWDLYARVFAGDAWGPRRKLTEGHYPNVFHRLARDSKGNLHLVWVGHDGGKSYVYWSRLQGDSWSTPMQVSGPSAWVPEAAADSSGALWVAWDSYRNGNYDIYLRKISAGGDLGPEIQVTKTDLFQTHPSLAIDAQDRVWLAWHESGAQWGKDWTHEDTFRSTVLYAYRRPRVAVYDGSSWKEPAMNPQRAFPDRYWRYVQNPRISIDGQGRVWLGAQSRTGSGHQRNDFWAFDGRWEFLLTSLEGDRWADATPVPESSGRPEGALLLSPQAKGVRLAWSNDNRPAKAPGFYTLIPNRYEVWTGALGVKAPPKAPLLVEYKETPLGGIIPVHPDETSELERIRGYRTRADGQQLQILRGDFHRHTEISTDGSGDGSIEDYFRYMLDAGAMDTGIVGDHNEGNDDEYSWWRTEKMIDVFLIPGRYTPMFGYERSPNYPNGHRNVVFAQRGVPTLPIPPEEHSGKIPTGPILYPYLRQYDGICMPHSLATSQGTDFRDWDEKLEPLVELYQGYHASYEYAGAPKAESDDVRVTVHGKYEPAGFWWNALAKGRRLGVEASSDHISTHASYTVIYTPSRDRKDVLESMRARHVYAATDNIVLDVQAETADGKRHFMGDAFASSRPPKIHVKVLGTDPIFKIDIVRDQKFVYHSEPGTPDADFEFVDNEPPTSGESYYYVRIQQRDRNMAWSSPIWVDYGK